MFMGGGCGGVDPLFAKKCRTISKKNNKIYIALKWMNMQIYFEKFLQRCNYFFNYWNFLYNHFFHLTKLSFAVLSCFKNLFIYTCKDSLYKIVLSTYFGIIIYVYIHIFFILFPFYLYYFVWNNIFIYKNLRYVWLRSWWFSTIEVVGIEGKCAQNTVVNWKSPVCVMRWCWNYARV